MQTLHQQKSLVSLALFIQKKYKHRKEFLNHTQFREKQIGSGGCDSTETANHPIISDVFLWLGLNFSLLSVLLVCTQRKVGLLQRLRNRSLLHHHHRGGAGAGAVPHSQPMALGHTGETRTWSGEPQQPQVKHMLLHIDNPL